MLATTTSRLASLSRVALLQPRLPVLQSASTNFSTEGGSDLSPELKSRLDSLVSASDVVVFMKGVPAQPRCGFSNAVVQIMRMHGVEFSAHDVLADEELRQGVKDYSNWPTIPQVYLKGEFVGGCDILLNMHQSGELVEELGKVGIKSALLAEEEEESKKDDEKK